MEISYSNFVRKRRIRNSQWSDQDAVVVWENPKTGEVRYPGKNTAPIPQRYIDQGFERKEMRSLREVERFEREHNVRSEMAWYDRGSGHGAEDGNRYGV